MGDHAAAQGLRWTTFETTLDAGMLRDRANPYELFPVVSQLVV
jgi:hypothetical protein